MSGYDEDDYQRDPRDRSPPPLPPSRGRRGPPHGRRVEAHRATAVLVLGICGIVVCFICGIFAWVMGAADLAKMRAGTMDRSGEEMTRVGYILGIVGSLLAALSLVLVILWLIFAAAVVSTV